MALKKFAFNILKKDKFARCGLIETHRGNIKTPAFMPVGTQATVKACTIDDVKKTGSEIILSNTYHLMIRPGVDRIISAGVPTPIKYLGLFIGIASFISSNTLNISFCVSPTANPPIA